MKIYRKADRPIEIVDYNSNWPVMYEQEKVTLSQALEGFNVVFEHIGSTSVPGLAAKPVIDIAVGINDLSLGEQLVKEIETLGYTYEPDFELIIPDRKFLWKGKKLFRTYHVSIMPVTGRTWINALLFRDYLRAHPEARLKYAELKRSLAIKHITDVTGYVNDKTSFIESILTRAKK
jgi:GrpB-like predicted nucleotidyltransferase (UPF0157 family)